MMRTQPLKFDYYIPIVVKRWIKIGQKDGHLLLVEQGATQLLSLSYSISKNKMRGQIDLVQPESTNQGMLGSSNQINHFFESLVPFRKTPTESSL